MTSGDKETAHLPHLHWVPSVCTPWRKPCSLNRERWTRIMDFQTSGHPHILSFHRPCLPGFKPLCSLKSLQLEHLSIISTSYCFIVWKHTTVSGQGFSCLFGSHKPFLTWGEVLSFCYRAGDWDSGKVPGHVTCVGAPMKNKGTRAWTQFRISCPPLSCPLNSFIKVKEKLAVCHELILHIWFLS